MSAHVRAPRRAAHAPARPYPAATPANTAFFKVYAILIGLLAFIGTVTNPFLMAGITILAIVVTIHWLVVTTLHKWRN